VQSSRAVVIVWGLHTQRLRAITLVDTDCCCFRLLLIRTKDFTSCWVPGHW
jgi:hypothetical protein